MSNDTTTSFLLYYIRSLGERTRVEKTSTKFGFDWIMYNLALADNLIPHRLPFFRAGPEDISKTKTEPEFGIDFAFLSSDRQGLTILVLKDEPLCNSTWHKNSFDSDLWSAAAPDLTPVEFRDVKSVRVVLVYNKDEDQTGVRLFENLSAKLGTKVGDKVDLSFERWNLTAVTEQVKSKLLTPSLLPQNYFSHFSYICSQFADFRHGSDAWVKQLTPNWQRFLADLLKDNADERSVRLLPVALIILKELGRENSSAETGWIDLVEWGMLSVWQVFRTTTNADVKSAISQMFDSLYLVELKRFYDAHAPELGTEHSLEIRGAGSYLDTIASAVVAHWHLGRLGILALGCEDFWGGISQADHDKSEIVLRSIANCLAGLLNANPSAKRPLLDIHHVELFLVWWTFWKVERKDDIFHWLVELHHPLLVRRAGTSPLPFLEGRNSLDLVLEFAATNQKPPEFCDGSSVLLLCILELCFSIEPEEKRDQLIAMYYRHIVLGLDTNGEQMGDSKPIDLMGWSPPLDWGTRILSKCLADDGESQTIETFEPPPEFDGRVIAGKIHDFVHQSRTAQRFEFPDDLPDSVIVLACLKHHSPLPPEIWRVAIFGPITTREQSAIRATVDGQHSK